ncbi:hypothetical protein C8R43DRAFT_1143428 [Mycena crocata]|nr:hypothetical protein C8R43DRAFT_1143428 [Mycena crocata]
MAEESGTSSHHTVPDSEESSLRPTHPPDASELQDAVRIITNILGTDPTNKARATLRPILDGLEQQHARIAQSAIPQDTSSINISNAVQSVGLMYGTPISGVEPMEPAEGEFVWTSAEYVVEESDEALLPAIQLPPPCPSPPKNCWYPQAPPFHLAAHNGYRRKKVFLSNFNVVDKPLIRQRALCTINPPDIDPTFDANGHFVKRPLPGMTEQILGIPYVQTIDNNARQTVTVAVAQTRKSLEIFGHGIAARVEVLEDELYALAFGSNPHRSDLPSITALYKLGLKRNDRSGKPPPGSTSNNGSYSLASTVEKGQGQGCFQPAVQISTPAAQHLIRRTLTIVHELQQLILPCCLSKFEWEMFRFMADDNNVFVFGGLGPGATGLQMNISEGMGNLEFAIGSLQGKWHTDVSDAFSLWTFGILLLKLPPGSDPGPFMFGRTGLYVRETGMLIIYLVFRGNDLHSGFHPSYVQGVHDAWIEKEKILAAYNLSDPEQRCFLVPYPTEVGYSRTAELAVTPPLTFGNLGAPVLHKLHSRTFAGKTANHSLVAIMPGIKFDMPTAEIFKKLKYTDENGQLCTVGPPPFDVELDGERIMKMRRFAAWHKQLSRKYLIRVTKDMIQTVHSCIAFQRQLDEDLFLGVERRAIQPLRMRPAPPTGPPGQIITEVLGRDLVGGEIVWKLRVSDEDQVMVVPESDTEWLYQHPNRGVLAAFVRSHIPLTSAALRKLYQRMITEDESASLIPLSASPDQVLARPGNVDVHGTELLVEPQQRPLNLDRMDEPGDEDEPASLIPLSTASPDQVLARPGNVDVHGTELLVEPQQRPLNLDRMDGPGDEDEARVLARPGNVDVHGTELLVEPQQRPLNLDRMDEPGDEDPPDNFLKDPPLDFLQGVGARSGDRFTADDEVHFSNLGNSNGREIPSEGDTESSVGEDLFEGDLTPSPPSDGGAMDDDRETQQDAYGDHDEDDEQMYEIEGIVGYRRGEDKRQEWSVRWKGYRKKDDQWLTAQAIFDAYNERHNIVVESLKRARSADWDGFESDPEPKKKKQKKRRRKMQEPSTDEITVPEPVLVETTMAYLAFTKLLSSTFLEDQLSSLRSAQLIQASTTSIKLVNPSHVLIAIGELNITNNWISSYLQYDTLSNNSAVLRITQLQEIVNLAGTLFLGLEQTAVLRQAIQWELGDYCCLSMTGSQI